MQTLEEQFREYMEDSFTGIEGEDLTLARRLFFAGAMCCFNTTITRPQSRESRIEVLGAVRQEIEDFANLTAMELRAEDVH